MAHLRSIISTDGAWRLGASLIICLGTVLTACTAPAKPPAGSVDRIGVVLLSEAPDGAVSGQATFTRLGNGRAEALLAAPLGSQLGTCRVNGTGGPSTEPGDSGGTSSRLNAGNVTLYAGGATYASLSRTDSGRYEWTGGAEPLPASLSIDLAKSIVFPAFTNLSLAVGAAPRLAAGVDPAAITTETTFAWEPAGAGGAVLLIGTGGGVSFSCLADDALGSFSFPEVTRQALIAEGFDSGALDVFGRITSIQATSGSALLMVNTIRLTHPGNE